MTKVQNDHEKLIIKLQNDNQAKTQTIVALEVRVSKVEERNVRLENEVSGLN